MNKSISASRHIACSALFLDRDGVINVDYGYVHTMDRFEFLPGIFELARFWTQDVQRPIVVVTNQAGIGRGYFTEGDYQNLTRWMCDRFAAEGAAIQRVYHCPYHPTDGVGAYRADHPWRKPNPGMFLQAAADLDLDLGSCIIIGDKMSDICAAAAAGVDLRVLIGVQQSFVGGDVPSHRAVIDLAAALVLLREHTARLTRP
jgi:D-glycero-D-manno-heptose 1,7-bisphosphate phosphatase